MRRGLQQTDTVHLSGVRAMVRRMAAVMRPRPASSATTPRINSRQPTTRLAVQQL